MGIWCMGIWCMGIEGMHGGKSVVGCMYCVVVLLQATQPCVMYEAYVHKHMHTYIYIQTHV